MKSSARYALSIGVSAVLLAGCGGTQLPTVAPGELSQKRATALSEDGSGPQAALNDSLKLTHQNKTTGPLLYVTNYGFSEVTVYHANAKNPAPIYTITNSLNFPSGDCIDSEGTLYVTNEPINGSGWVAEYPFGTITASTIITKGISTPAYCAIDADGNLWVTNIGTPNATEYLRGSKKPHTVITDGMAFPVGIAIDQSGNLYVSNRLSSGSNVVVYAPGSKTPSRVITDAITSPVGIAIDANGVLYVANVDQQNVEEYRPGADSPFQTITQGLPTPSDVTVDEKGWLYVPNGSGANHRVEEFPPGEITPSKRHVSKVNGPIGVAIYPAVLP